MTRLEIEWPDEAAERVRAAEARLRLAGSALRARSFESRLTAVAAVLADWTAPDSPWRRELAVALAAESPFHEATIREGLDSALRAFDPEDFMACARRELGTVDSPRRTLVPYEWTTVLAGGSIPMPTILEGLIPLVLGSPVLLRETSKDPVTARLLSRSLAARDPDLANCFRSVAFPAEDASAFEVALGAPCIVATGSDETLASIRHRLRPDQRFVGFGHRFSIAIVGPGVADSRESLRSCAAGLALDVARWDQSGCLSPVAVYLLDLPADSARALAEEISKALLRLEDVMPRGELDRSQAVSIANERAEARMRLGDDDGMLFEASTHTVMLESECRPRPAPLGRFLRLLPVGGREELVSALSPFAGHLSSVATFGIDPKTSTNIDSAEHGSLTESMFAALTRLGVSRFTEPGRLQAPPIDWPHDGLPVFLPRARFAGSD